MRLDFANKRFICDGGDGKVGEECVKALNDSVGVPQTLNLSFNDVAFDLKGRKIHFVAASGSNLMQALGDVDQIIRAHVSPENIFSVVLLLVINSAVTFEQIETVVTAFEKAIPQIKTHLGIAQKIDLKNGCCVYAIVAENDGGVAVLETDKIRNG